MPNNRPRLRGEPPPPRRIPQPSFDELEQGLLIDEHNLRRDCVQHSVLMYQISRQLNALESQRDFTKKRLDALEASAAKRIRRDAEQADVKVTVSEVNSEVALDMEVMAASTEILELGEQIGHHKALRDAYIHRRDMLKELVSMELRDYYSDPARGGEAQVRNISHRATEGLQRAYRARREQSNQED